MVPLLGGFTCRRQRCHSLRREAPCGDLRELSPTLDVILSNSTSQVHTSMPLRPCAHAPRSFCGVALILFQTCRSTFGWKMIRSSRSPMLLGRRSRPLFPGFVPRKTLSFYMDRPSSMVYRQPEVLVPFLPIAILYEFDTIWTILMQLISSHWRNPYARSCLLRLRAVSRK